jgi:hypothetical protein
MLFSPCSSTGSGRPRWSFGIDARDIHRRPPVRPAPPPRVVAPPPRRRRAPRRAATPGCRPCRRGVSRSARRSQSRPGRAVARR